MSYLPCSIQSLLQTVVIFRTDLSRGRNCEIFSSSVILVCQTLSAVFIQNSMIPLRQIRDVITSSVSFTFRENEFAADNKASLPFQSLFTIFIFLCCFFRECLRNRNQSWMISPDWLNTFRIYFHAHRSLVQWALRMPVSMNILLVMTKRKKPCAGFFKMLNKSKSLHCR